ncbi:hypothetical protein F5I97DRAFT_435839 [Phlebopus sp. FC_14]|nr:hypothetical protein F5I97DRAFT_435839 [Phlebopus sp. FC_14]
MSENHTTTSVPLLPAPRSLDDPSVPDVPLGIEVPVKLDNLGPMVVNSDGTLSRIANWEHMTAEERERTMRIVAARNRARLAKQKENEGSSGSLSTAS